MAKWSDYSNREHTMGFLQGKRALITGIASERSIASGIAEAMHREGAELAFTYQNDKLKTRVEKAAEEYGGKFVAPLDVASDEQIAACFEEVGKHWGDGFDIKPRKVLDQVTAVACGDAATIARTMDGKMWQWDRGVGPRRLALR